MAKRERVYSEYDRKYQAQPKQVAKRVSRNKARRWKIKEVGKVALKWKDVWHKKPLEKWGKTTKSNIKIQSVKSNRSDKSMLKKASSTKKK